MERLKVGAAAMPRSVKTTVEVARVAERAGFDAFGIGEGPFLHHDVYAATTACLLATERIPIGPLVTNPVTRHWTAHASTARTLDELAPGRFFFGVGTGDGAVRSVGLAPMRWSDLAATVSRIRERTPAGLRVHCTVSGPKGAETAGTFADVVVVATGADATAIRALGALARNGSTTTAQAEVWTMIPTLVVDDEGDVASARDAMRIAAYSTAHFAFGGTFASKNVPEEYQLVIRDCLSGYDYNFHGVVADDNPNPRAFDDHPEVGDYLLDRMCLVGTGPVIRDAVIRLAEDAGLQGIWFPTQTPDHALRLARALNGMGSLVA